MHKTLSLTLLVTLAACGNSNVSEETALETRLEEIEAHLTNVDDRLKEVENAQNPELVEALKRQKAADEERANRNASKLEGLRSGQRNVEENQEMLCAATGDC